MRIVIAALAALTAYSVSAEAGCLNEMTLPGHIGPKTKSQRSFTLFRPRAGMFLLTDDANDKLSFIVYRPNGQLACKLKGPGTYLTCDPTIDSKKKEGVHRIVITNKMKHGVSYQLSCFNPP